MALESNFLLPDQIEMLAAYQPKRLALAVQRHESILLQELLACLEAIPSISQLAFPEQQDALNRVGSANGIMQIIFRYFAYLTQDNPLAHIKGLRQETKATEKSLILTLFQIGFNQPGALRENMRLTDVDSLVFLTALSHAGFAFGADLLTSMPSPNDEIKRQTMRFGVMESALAGVKTFPFLFASRNEWSHQAYHLILPVDVAESSNTTVFEGQLGYGYTI